ncbi:MAG: hypothetical protein QNL92_09705 [Octadecabacter sp.]
MDWLEPAAPYLLFLFATLIGSRSYLKQRKLERQGERQDSRMMLYREVIESSFMVFSALVDSAERARKGIDTFENQSGSFRELQAKYDALATCALYPQLAALDAYIDAISGYRTMLRIEFEEIKFTRKYKHLESDRQAHALATQARTAAIRTCIKEATTDVFSASQKDIDDLANLKYPTDLQIDDGKKI